jgi:hypothetical protein
MIGGDDRLRESKRERERLIEKDMRNNINDAERSKNHMGNIKAKDRDPQM